MTDYTELKRLAAAIESCTSIPEEDEAAWMRRTTGRAVGELLDELENFKAEVPKWTEREIKLIADNEALRGLYRMHQQTETREMRDLKAEIAGLRTGYEAYERGNAELKAEVEKLRKELAARHPFKFAQESPAIGFTGCVICGVFTDHGGLPCPKTRATAIAHAAMGKGGRS